MMCLIFYITILRLLASLFDGNGNGHTKPEGGLPALTHTQLPMPSDAVLYSSGIDGVWNTALAAACLSTNAFPSDKLPV